jgi:hypothetical protein
MKLLGLTRVDSKVVDQLQNKYFAFISTGETVDEYSGN